MAWGAVELEPEVEKWLESLPTAQFAHAAFYVDLLAEQGPLLGEPYTKQLDRKLRELRFHPRAAGGPDHLLDRDQQEDHPADGFPQDADAGRAGDRPGTPGVCTVRRRGASDRGRGRLDHERWWRLGRDAGAADG